MNQNEVNATEYIGSLMEEELGLDLNKTVYRLCYSDIACIIADRLPSSLLKLLTADELGQMVSDIEGCFKQIPWMDYGEVGLPTFEDESED